MNTLRKRPTYDNLIDYLNHQPTIKYPARKGIRAINDPFISNLLFDDDLTDDKIIEKRKETIQVEKGTQTASLEKGTQKDYTAKYDYDEPENPHLYWKIDATSERLTHHLDNYWFNWFKPKQKMMLLLKQLKLKVLN